MFCNDMQIILKISGHGQTSLLQFIPVSEEVL